MKVTFPKFSELYKNKWPTRGTCIFLKIEVDLQAMPDVHHLAFSLPPFHWTFSVVDGMEELF